MIMEFFHYDFIIRALIIGLIVAVCAGILGNFIVASRNAIVSDMLAHAALAGVGLGIFWNIAPAASGAVVAILSALLLWYLGRKQRFAPEATSMLIMTGGLSVALVFSHLAKDNPLSLESFLFGSILTISPLDLRIGFVANVLVIVVVLLLWNRLRTSIIDPEYSQSRFAMHTFVQIVFMVLIGGFVAVSLQIIGGLLIGALLVIPVMCAQYVSRTFLQSVIVSIFCNVFAVLVGLYLSFVFDIPSSSSIVLSLIGLFLLLSITTQPWRHKRL